ncbi:Uncharacterized protein Rs2_04920 [Raphanus sativus]|nr:Uncharacterized protein Rs2_04920 [Raphanus sativus]
MPRQSFSQSCLVLNWALKSDEFRLIPEPKTLHRNQLLLRFTFVFLNSQPFSPFRFSYFNASYLPPTLIKAISYFTTEHKNAYNGFKLSIVSFLFKAYIVPSFQNPGIHGKETIEINWKAPMAFILLLTEDKGRTILDDLRNGVVEGGRARWTL